MPIPSRHRTAFPVLAAVVTLLAAAGARAQAPTHHPADSAAVAATVQRFHAALAAADSAGAMALLAPEVVILESGDSESRAEYRAHHLAADIEFARAVHGEQDRCGCG